MLALNSNDFILLLMFKNQLNCALDLFLDLLYHFLIGLVYTVFQTFWVFRCSLLGQLQMPNFGNAFPQND
jgi:hypothetical protein